MSPWRRRLRRARRWSLGLLAAGVILLGLLVALLSQLLPMLESRPEQVARWLSERAGIEVRVERARGEWNGRGLRFDLGGLALGIGDGLRIDRAVLQVNLIAGLWPGTPLTSLQLQSPSILARRGRDGRWAVEGLGLRSPAAMPDLSLVERLGEVVLDGASLRLVDELRGTDWTLDRVDARLRTRAGRTRLGLRAYQQVGAPLQLRLDLDAARGEGRIYADLPESDLAPWVSEWLPSEWNLPQARLAAQAWARVVDGQIERVRFDARLSGTPMALEGDLATPPQGPTTLPALALRGEWTGTLEAWRLLLAEPEAQGGWLALDHAGELWALQATGWSLPRWSAWLAQNPLFTPSQRAQIEARQPSGRIEGLRLDWGGGREPTLRAVLRGLGLKPLGNQPGVAHLDLSLDGVGERIAVRVQSPQFRFDWPTSLRSPFQPALSGDLLLWRTDDEARSWCLSALDLALDEPGQYRIDAEADLCFDGEAPRVELRAEVAATDITVAKRFWIINKMPPTAVQWLDDALVGGRLARGRVLLSGDLADWPFHNQAGRFEAIADLDQVDLRYRPDWPLGERLSGEARFLNAGMEVDLQAQIGGIAVQRVSGGIARFRDGQLLLDIEGEAQGADMLAFLRSTPLWAKLSTGLEHVAIEGPGRIRTRLDILLKKDARPPKVDGEVELQDADLRHAQWGIAFDAARGNVVFSERGVRVDRMPVLHGGRPAQFSLAVGSFASDPLNVTEASLGGRLDPQALIDTQPELNWLKPYLLGASQWDITLAVPARAGAAPSLRLRSDLVGTELTLPAPLRKSEAVPMTLDLRLDLAAPDKAVDLRLGELLRLRGVLNADQPFNGLAEFGDSHGLIERPARGIAVIGQVPVLDTSGWLGLAVGGGEGLLQSIDLQCGELDVLGRPFPETRMRYRRGADALLVDFEGTALHGSVEVPGVGELAQRGITARFERLFWPSSEQDQDVSAGLDPRVVPPLHVHARDLHLGGAELGETRLESFPTAEGMRIEQFHSRSDALELSARGDWLRRADHDESSFDVEFTAQDLGGMLRALGFAEFVEGGQTLATLKARWLGPPASFGLQKSQGELVLSVGKGRIPDVEPGAGRLFGLLSLSQIPRRLALDFSDFFRSGLSFNRIEGAFVLGGGQARTDNLLIDSPAAEIRIRGSTGLASQSYDQTMEVLPRAGSVLPIVGALAGGPAGAALGAVAQAVLQKPFKQITRTVYRVSGPWSKPQIDVLERGPGRDAAPTAQPAPPPPAADPPPPR